MLTGLLIIKYGVNPIIIKYLENCTATLFQFNSSIAKPHMPLYVYIYTLSHSTFTKREAQYRSAGLTTYNIHYYAENLLMPV